MDDEQPLSSNGVHPGSMAERARAMRENMLSRKTVVMEVAGYEGMLAVEYRGLGYAEARTMASRLERVSDETQRDLYFRADQMIAASVNAFDIRSDPKRELGFGWGIALAAELGVDKAEELTPRQAVLACFPGDYQYKLVEHTIELGEWFRGASNDVDLWQAQDFPVTS